MKKRRFPKKYQVLRRWGNFTPNGDKKRGKKKWDKKMETITVYGNIRRLWKHSPFMETFAVYENNRRFRVK